jgi:2Fe-2S ferredoxin
LAKVIFHPSGKEVEVNLGENFLKVSIRADVGLKYNCGGAPSCAMCKVVVQSGEEFLNPQEMKELDLMGNTYFITKKRLACQTKFLKEGEVHLDISEHLENTPAEKEASSFRKPESEWRKCDSERSHDPTRRDTRPKSSGGARKSQGFKGRRKGS